MLALAPLDSASSVSMLGAKQRTVPNRVIVSTQWTQRLGKALDEAVTTTARFYSQLAFCSLYPWSCKGLDIHAGATRQWLRVCAA